MLRSLIYKSERIGNRRKITNRFTGNVRYEDVHPTARLPVVFSIEQNETIMKLIEADRVVDAQRMILDLLKEGDDDG